MKFYLADCKFLHLVFSRKEVEKRKQVPCKIVRICSIDLLASLLLKIKGCSSCRLRGFSLLKFINRYAYVVLEIRMDMINQNSVGTIYSRTARAVHMQFEFGCVIKVQGLLNARHVTKCNAGDSIKKINYMAVYTV